MAAEVPFSAHEHTHTSEQVLGTRYHVGQQHPLTPELGGHWVSVGVTTGGEAEGETDVVGGDCLLSP